MTDGMLLELLGTWRRETDQPASHPVPASVCALPAFPSTSLSGGFCGVRVGLRADRCPKDVRRLKRLSAEGHGLHPASVFRACFPKAQYLTPLPESMSSRPAGAFFFFKFDSLINFFLFHEV